MQSENKYQPLTAKQALQRSGKFIPWRVMTVSVDGRILED